MNQMSSNSCVLPPCSSRNPVPEEIPLDRGHCDGTQQGRNGTLHCRPHSDLVTYDRRIPKPCDISPDAIMATVALPFTYDGRKPQVEMAEYTPAPRNKIVLSRIRSSSVPAIENSSAVVGHIQNHIGVSDTPPEEQTTAETSSYTHSAAKDEERRAYVTTINRHEPRNSCRSFAGEVDHIEAYAGCETNSVVRRKPLPDSAVCLGRCVQAGNISRALRLAHPGVRGSSMSSQATGSREGPGDDQALNGVLAEQLFQPNFQVAAGRQKPDEMLNPYADMVEDAPFQQKPAIAPQ